MSYPTLFTTLGLKAFAEAVDDEVQRQYRQWGEQRHPDGTGRPGDRENADRMRAICKANGPGQDNWRDILAEEIAEAFAETDPELLVVELVQCAAVIQNWITTIKGRSSSADATTPARAEHQPVALATPCAHCSHPYNWHASRGNCEFGNETTRCACTRFAPGARPEPVNPWHILGVHASATTEDAQRAARRDSLRVLLGRAQRVGLTWEEGDLLRQHTEAEMRESDTARVVAAGNLRHVQSMYADMQRVQEQAREAGRDLAREQSASAGRAEKIKEQRAALDQLRGHLRYVLDYRGPGHEHLEAGRWDRDGSRCDHCARLAEARAALGDGEPTTEQPSYSVLRTAYDESWQLIRVQKDLLGTLRGIVMTSIGDREAAQVTAEQCEHCGQDHMAELYNAIALADVRYAEKFPATADGPARPGRLPQQRTTEA